MAQNTMPSHMRMATFRGFSAGAESDDIDGTGLSGDAHYTVPGRADATFKDGAIVVCAEGSGKPLSVMQPDLAQYPRVAIEGIYPSRT